MRKKLFGSRVRRIITITAALCLFGGGAAFAYFVSQGAGTGSQAVTGTVTGPGASPLVINVGTNANSDGTSGIAITAPLYGGATVPIDFSVDNIASTSAVQIPSISTTVQVDSVHAAAGCLASFFTVTPGTLLNANNGGPIGALPYLLPQSPSGVGTGISDFVSSNQTNAWKLSFPTDGVDNETSCVGASLTVTVNVP